MAIPVAPTYAFVRATVGDEEADPFALALGKALDVAISQYNYYYILSGRVLVKQAIRCAMAVFSKETARLGLELTRELRDRAARRLWRMVCCWASGPYTHLKRPRTHAIIVSEGEFMGALLAQPDFYSQGLSGAAFYEVKSFDVESEPKKHVRQQARVFSVLGPLTLVFFREEGGRFTLESKKLTRDLSVLDEVLEFLRSSEGLERWEVKKIKGLYPYRIFVRIGGEWSLVDARYGEPRKRGLRWKGVL